MIVAGSGYVINDIFDLQADAINRRTRQIIGKRITVSSALWFYRLLIILGFLLTIYLGLHIGKPLFIAIYPLSIWLLWLYSSHLKRVILVGNFIVSLFCAGVIILVWLPFYLYPLPTDREFPELHIVFWSYALFGFITTLYREIVKDIEDVEGDTETGLKTLAVIYPINKAKKYGQIIGGLLVVCLVWWIIISHRHLEWISTVYLTILVIVPAIISIFMIHKATRKSDFSRISRLIKSLMIFGIIYLLLL
jgi:4-hydroxybenzoate polyprenyltransferase